MGTPATHCHRSLVVVVVAAVTGEENPVAGSEAVPDRGFFQAGEAKQGQKSRLRGIGNERVVAAEECSYSWACFFVVTAAAAAVAFDKAWSSRAPWAVVGNDSVAVAAAPRALPRPCEHGLA